MSRDRRTRLALAALALLALAALAGCHGDPDPSEYSVCSVCRTDLSDETGVGPAVTQTATEVHVRFRADGSARWAVHVALAGPDVERLRANDSLRARLARQAVADGSAYSYAPDEPRNLSSRMDGDTLVVAYDYPAAGRAFLGRAVVTGLVRTHGLEVVDHVVLADRVVLHAPPGWTPLQAPEAATVRSDAVVFPQGTTVDGTRHVVFGRSDTAGARAAATASVAAAVADWVVLPTAVLAGLPLLVGLALGAVGLRDLRGDAPRPPRGRLARRVGLAFAVAVLFGGPAAAALAAAPASLLALPVGLAVLAAPVGLGLLAGLAGGSRPTVAWGAVAAGLVAVPVVALWFALLSNGFSASYLLAVVGAWGWAVGAGLLAAGAYGLGRRVEI